MEIQIMYRDKFSCLMDQYIYEDQYLYFHMDSENEPQLYFQFMLINLME